MPVGTVVFCFAGVHIDLTLRSSKIIISVARDVFSVETRQKDSPGEVTLIVNDLNDRTEWYTMQSRASWFGKEERRGVAAVNFHGELPRRYDAKLSSARIHDLSLCRTLEMNPRKKSDNRVGAHFGNAILNDVAIYRCENSEMRDEVWEALGRISLSTNTSTISRMPRAVR